VPNPLPKGGVVAVVNDQEITEAEYADALAAGALMALQATPEGRKKVLNSLIESTLLVQDAIARGLRERLLVRRVIERYERQVLAGMSQQHLIESVPPVTQAELDTEIGDPGERLDMTVFLTDELLVAQKALARIKAGERFEDVAAEVSSAPGLGSPAAIQRKGFSRGGGMYPPEVEDAVFAVPKGQISAPIRTPVGFLVVRIDDRRQPTAEELEKLRELARTSIESVRREEALQKEIGKRREKARVETLVRNIDSVKLPDPNLNAAALWQEIEKVEVARVDGLTLTLGDLFRDDKQYRKFVQAVGQTRAVTYQKGLEGAITSVMLARYGREKGLDASPALRAAVDGFTKTVLQAQSVNDIYLGIVEADIDEKACRAFFTERSLGAKTPEFVVLSHILVRREADLELVLARLRIGSTFEALAREFSVAPTASAGGDVGPRFATELGDLLDRQGTEELLKKARAGEKGPIAIRTTGGYNIFLVREYKAAGTASYEDQSAKVRPVYLEHCRQEAIKERIASLKEKAVIFIDDGKVLSIQPASSGASGVSPHGGGAKSAPAPGPSPHGAMPQHP
jgi:parvulin-like peptidyl-prolyl isomerase